ncbi:hypothetical protein [Nocardia sp. NPDC060255]|uniref:hypothetical protein n=1 Tax=Nocardia sp. NPDC060255 TaxID=3347085 RepID=UPI00364DDF72
MLDVGAVGVTHGYPYRATPSARSISRSLSRGYAFVEEDGSVDQDVDVVTPLS